MFLNNKLAVASCCAVDEAIGEALRLFPNVPPIKEKQRKCIDLLKGGYLFNDAITVSNSIRKLTHVDGINLNLPIFFCHFFVFIAREKKVSEFYLYVLLAFDFFFLFSKFITNAIQQCYNRYTLYT